MKENSTDKSQKRKSIKSIKSVGQCEKSFYVKFDRGRFLGQHQDFVSVRELARKSLEKFKHLLNSEDQEPTQK
jgi:hypothetical protein